MKIREHSVTTDASLANAIWQRWTNTKYWPEDDPDTKSASFAAPPTVGVKGTVLPVKGPKSRMEITRFEPNQHFYIQTHLPAATLAFEHDMAMTDDGRLLITHRIVFVGPLSFFFDKVIGSSIEKGFPNVMTNIVSRSKK